MTKKLFFAALMALATITVSAQQGLPLDPNVRTGKLENGMTYYIRHNNKPENRADFYIAQKVGSVLEEENQRGLAHFLEHMAFNGTANYPKKAMLDYLEKNGVKFGENVNAGTGIDETVYMVMNVPTHNKGLVDSCLLVLHDWSSFISLEEEEIDNERGVILEELRSRNNSGQRLMENYLKIIYPNCRYGDRLPGGSPEVVANFSYQTLRDYYQKWYRPDLQGIIIVGDVDVDETENRIKTMFADIKAPVNPTPRPFIEVADNIDPIVAIATDPEEEGYQVMLFYKQDIIPDSQKNSMEYFVQDYALDILSDMMNNRLRDLTQEANPPFVYAYDYYDDFFVSPTKDAWTSVAGAKDAAGIDEALTTIVHENQRMLQFGFTESEYERAKADFMKEIESKYNDRENQKNETFVNECLSNFLYNEPMMGIENEYTFFSQFVPMIPLQAINELAKVLIADTNMVLVVTAPQKEGEVLPTEEELLAIIDKASKDEVKPYEEFVSNVPLIEKAPKAGKIKKENDVKLYDATEWTLSNGVRVVVKPTKFKEDEIQMTGFSFGGTSVMNLKDAATVKTLHETMTIGGIGNFSAKDLPKILAGKKVNVEPYISSRIEGITGKSTPKDIETMMQLIYLYFTQPRVDEEAFQSYLTRSKAVLDNAESNPFSTFQDSINSVLYNNHPFALRTKLSDLENIDYKLAIKLYKDRFADAKDFVFIFVGNIDTESFKPLVEQYLGSLPTTKRKESWVDNGLNFATGDKKCYYEKKVETPISTILLVKNGNMDYNIENKIYMKAFSDIMRIVYTEKVREDEGGTYGVDTYGDLRFRPEGNYFFQIVFQTNADVKEKLLGIIKDELANVSTNGPSEINLNKEKDFLLKHHQELMQENSYWLSVIEDYYCDGIDAMNKYEAIVNNITVESMRDFAKKVMNGYSKEIIQDGVKE